MEKVIILRGVSGTSKSTYANKFIYENPNNFVIVSADDYGGYYANEGMKYVWTPEICTAAHKWCKQIFVRSIVKNLGVIVDNTNLQQKSWWFYYEMAQLFYYQVEFVEFIPKNISVVELAARNRHGLDANKIYQMIQAFQPLPKDINAKVTTIEVSACTNS